MPTLVASATHLCNLFEKLTACASSISIPCANQLNNIVPCTRKTANSTAIVPMQALQKPTTITFPKTSIFFPTISHRVIHNIVSHFIINLNVLHHFVYIFSKTHIFHPPYNLSATFVSTALSLFSSKIKPLTVFIKISAISFAVNS